MNQVQPSRRLLLGGALGAAVASISAVAADPASADTRSDLPKGVKVPRRPDNLRQIVEWDAATLSLAIHKRVVSCVEVMTAYLDQIDEYNPKVNAIVSLRPRADLLAEAAQRDKQLKRHRSMGWMHGFPQAVKDLANVKGLPTSLGFFKAAPPAAADSIFVERVRAAGAIFIGKTNTPEFGLGSNTYNNVFGITGNAWNPVKSAGGSSGGAAVAVALKMLPVADGSDFFGSLRNPPGWNNVYGLRPSYGRVPGAGADTFVQQGGYEGPIARNPLDLALMLTTMAGYDARAPLSIEQDPATFARARPARRGLKIAWLGNLGGYLPMEPEVLSVTNAAVARFADLGATVTKVNDLPSVGTFQGNASLWKTWLIYRHWLIGGILQPFYTNPTYRAQLKPEAIYEVEGLVSGADGNPAISGLDTWNGSVLRTNLYNGFLNLFKTYDYVVAPTAQVFPFDATTPWPKEINGTPMSSYHRWMEVTAIGTLLNAPVAAIPAGFSASGLPIGLQVIGRNHDDLGVLEVAAAWEANGNWSQRRPPLLGR